MKFKRSIIALTILALGALALPACNSKKPVDPTPAPEPEPPTPEPEEPWYKKSERAMASLLDKIQTQGYTMVGGDLTTAVYDQNMVTWFFPEGSMYTDNVAVTVNEETFAAFIDNDKQLLAEITFIDKKPAQQINAVQKLLPTYWLTDVVSGGNIWTIFKNDNPDNPYHYRGLLNQYFYYSLCDFCNINEMIAPTISDVEMQLDAEDVKLATIKFNYQPTAGVTNNATITITFGQEVKRSQLVLDWVANPDRELPEDVGDLGKWPSQVQNMIFSKFSTGSDDLPLPFDTFFSYAVKFNSDTYLYEHFVKATDYHAGELEAKQYMQTLISRGYQAEIGSTGQVFRSPSLRERNGYHFYSDITIEINNGVTITANMSYSKTTYTGRDVINNYLLSKSDHFVAMPDSSNISRWHAVDDQFCIYEDHACMYEYNTWLYVYFDYKNQSDMDAYVKAYTDDLVKNHGYAYSEGDDNYFIEDLSARTCLRVRQDDKGNTTLVFYNSVRVLPADFNASISAAGFPTINCDKVTSIMEIRGYQKSVYGMDYTHYYWASFRFDTSDDMMALIGDYETQLVAAGFVKTSWESRTFAYKLNNQDDVMAIFAFKETGTQLGIEFAIR